MEAMILKFVASARAAGMRISTAETLDCLAQLPRVDVLDERQFSTVLRANFAKSRLERARFDHLYQLFFHEIREDLDPASVSLAGHMETLQQVLLSLEPQMPAIAEFLAAEPAAYLKMLQEMQSEGHTAAGGPRGAGSNLGSLVRRLPVLRALHRARDTVNDFLQANWDQIHWETRQALKRHAERRLETARRLLADNGPPLIVADEKKTTTTEAYGELGRQPFANLSPGELVRLRDVIAQLVRKLKDMVSLRYAARSRGILDVKRTLRAAARTQGIPIGLRFRRKPPRKGRIVVLCDVSGSVWSSARFMLSMLYALQDCFDRVKSFVFIDEPVEVTPYFDDFDIERALEEIMHSTDIAYGASTDYGRTLRLFKARHMDTINKKTTVILIGDGRTNYGNPEEGILEEMRDRSRRIIWLNPETEQFWNSGDSEMRTYEVLCNEVRACWNLNQLAAFIQDLVL
ncbi:MAG: VWA domain-containing protein [Desulfobacteraceae bacterium]|nr:VWA domain-containing protein [Desulfobacteraceae bacterium]MBC2752988.1 VWA domain-containing protein [Desulfobacteraceae bacterium]